MQTQYTRAQVEITEKGMVAVASTGGEDRHGEIVEAEGWDLKNFKKNPILLWAHDHTQPPIGVAKKVWIEGTGKKGKLMFEPVFHEVTDFARAIKRLYEEKILRSFSVGFRPIESEGDTFKEQELLEISGVNVPANAEAMNMAYKSLKEEGIKNETMKKIGIPAEFVEEMGRLKEEVSIIKSQLDTAVKGLQHLNPHTIGRKQILEDRLLMTKLIAKANDRLVANKDPRRQRILMAKIAKRTSEKLIVSLKGELDGKNQRT